ncbi:MAG: hypothetical protein QM669_04065 [Siphonobacter sp.]
MISIYASIEIERSINYHTIIQLLYNYTVVILDMQNNNFNVMPLSLAHYEIVIMKKAYSHVEIIQERIEQEKGL